MRTNTNNSLCLPVCQQLSVIVPCYSLLLAKLFPDHDQMALLRGNLDEEYLPLCSEIQDNMPSRLTDGKSNSGDLNRQLKNASTTVSKY